MEPLAVLRRINTYIHTVARRQYDATAVGPFMAYLHPTSSSPWFSYAVPSDRLGDGRDIGEAIQSLRALYHEHGRNLRFEFIADLWPELPALLERAALRAAERNPLMVCGSSDLRPIFAPSVQARFITENDDLAAYQALRNEAFGGPRQPATPELAEEVRAQMRQGIRYAVGLVDGVPAGGGGYLPAGGVAELVGIATLPTFRRRGVAATVSSLLTQDHFERGGDLAWLTAGDAAAEAVYRRIGFSRISTGSVYSE
jgi:ribosomal protein S18 acetylase RimI-like enzyme